MLIDLSDVDIPTAVLMAALLNLFSGALLTYAFLYYKDAPAALWWGISHIILGIGVLASMAGASTGLDWITAIAFVIFLICAAVQWHGTRLLVGARSYLPLTLVGPSVIAAVNFLPVGDAVPLVRGMVAMIMNIAYFAGALYVLVRPPSDRLKAYLPLAVLFVANIVAMMLAPFGGLGSNEAGLPPLLSLPGILHIEAQLFVLGTTIFVIAALRERNEQTQKKAAGTDALTGLANRAGFFELGSRLVARCLAEGTPFAVVAIDLDRFKSINDNHGHATGDAVLQSFATVARRSMRPNDVLGRIGGEEFVVLLHGSGMEAAVAIAERMRKSLQQAAEFVDGKRVGATMSAGVATSASSTSLEAVLKEADTALYRAKQNGRDRVEAADDSNSGQTAVVRVA